MRIQPLVLFLFLSLICSCVDSNISEIKQDNTEHIELPTDASNAIAGKIRIKLANEISDEIAFASAFPDMEIVSVRRTFPEGGKFEQRRRKAGLHLWYDITFNPKVAVTKAASDISQMDGIQYIEYVKPVRVETMDNQFNDSLLNKQWHYNNIGQSDKYLAGSDADVVNAWLYNAGSEDVIVAILDTGIDYDHEDLADAMWVNEAEVNGKAGVDDDENGYVDDFNGFNFVASGDEPIGTIYPGDHGTHVAGTVGAVNNNGKGVCGIAGGNGTKKGVRLMDCQIIRYEKEGAYVGQAFAYAADNGAVIANGSFSSSDGTFSQSEKEGIDYFIDNAGTDENGIQVGPMKGGLVIAAAGNYSTSTKSYPAGYERVIAVAAIGADYEIAYYSNFGDWVDVTAPGGDAKKGTRIMSTLPENTYGYMQGTSQATPHVSGVAALVVSHFGQEGFTCDKARYIIEHSCRNLDQYNPNYVGELGAGLVDAAKCIGNSSGTGSLSGTPRPIELIMTSALSNIITLKWLVTEEEGKVPYAYDLYYSKKSLDKLDLNMPLPEDVTKIQIITGDRVAGDTLSFDLPQLDFTTTYYFRADAYDVFEDHSELSAQYIQSTSKNITQRIVAIDGASVTLKSYQSALLRFTSDNPDHHNLTYTYTTASQADAIFSQGDTITIQISAPIVDEGEYFAKLKVEDEYGAADSLTIRYTVLQNHKPYLAKPFEKVILSKIKDNVIINLNDYIKDDDGEDLKYRVKVSSELTSVSTSIDKGKLTITADRYGWAEVTITGEDVKGETSSGSFSILARDGSKEIEIFPNPMEKELYLRAAEEIPAQVTIYSTLGAKVYDSAFEIGPFNRNFVDVSTLSPGAYVVNVEYAGKLLKRNMVKL